MLKPRLLRLVEVEGRALAGVDGEQYCLGLYAVEGGTHRRGEALLKGLAALQPMLSHWHVAVEKDLRGQEVAVPG